MCIFLFIYLHHHFHNLHINLSNDNNVVVQCAVRCGAAPIAPCCMWIHGFISGQNGMDGFFFSSFFLFRLLRSHIHSKSQIKWASDSFYRFICLYNNLCMWVFFHLSLFIKLTLCSLAAIQLVSHLAFCAYACVRARAWTSTRSHVFVCAEMLTQLYLIYYLILMQSMKNNN